jgi:ABC-type sulfate transport system permease subunit
MSTRASIALLINMMVNAVLFGAGTILVLSIPELSSQAAFLLPAVIIAAFLVSPLIAWQIAPMLRSRWQRAHGHTAR